ncbi:peroxisomal targeting signal 2 receptor [Coccinella septempunctata]|uniref:peroxisomal targeting signal 2 receptor n=1 Tax=Coccinella septempunctata TaxID=41139 RepID=UPI001D07BE04|nr:peroxisomal targeting signal 2 receptor [Coccinella septempunctata]
MPTIRLPDKQCSSVRFSPDNDSLLAVTACESPDPRGLRFGGSLHLLEITPQDTLKEILKFEHNYNLFDVEWCESNPNPSLILTASGDRNLQLWNVFAPKRMPTVLTGHMNEVLSINWCKITNCILSASSDHTIRFWDLNTKNAVHQYLQHKSIVYEAEFHPKFPNIFASVSADTCLKIWDTRSPISSSTILAHYGSSLSCTWSKCEENTIATGGGDSMIRGWDLRKFPNPIFELGPVMSPLKKVLFSPFSYGTLASVSDDGITRIWKCFEHKKPINIIQNHSSFVSGLDWNSSETTTHLGQLADCGCDGFVHIFNSSSN